jgi:hypothetical protein
MRRGRVCPWHEHRGNEAGSDTHRPNTYDADDDDA